VDEQRVAHRHGEACAPDRGVDLHAEDGLEQRPDRLLAQRLGQDDVGVPADRREQRGLSVVQHLAGAGGGDHRRTHATDARQRVEQPLERRSVRPLQVVDRHDERRRLREIGQEPVQPDEGGLALVGGREKAVGPGKAEHGGGQTGGAREHGRRAARGTAEDPAFEELADDAVRERALQLRATRAERQHPVAARQPARLGEQRGLADPGRAFDDQRAAVAGARRPKRRDDRVELPLTLQQASHGRPSVSELTTCCDRPKGQDAPK